MEKEEILKEIIKGLNKEKEILTELLPRVRQDVSIRIRGRLNEIDEQIIKFLKKDD